LFDDKEVDWRLKSRAIWLDKGDENTKFSHDFAKGRKEINNIWKLQGQGDSPATSFEDLVKLGITHFKSLFKDDPRENIADIIKSVLYFSKFMDKDENKDMFAEFMEKELKETIQSFQTDKIPRPDGWTIEFFGAFFDLIGADLLQVVKESRKNGHIYALINTTFIALIPKKDEPQSFGDLWPISLCNCLYKILSKIIVRRLKPILSNKISKEQFGFLQGR
jgi:hypothetical protein